MQMMVYHAGHNGQSYRAAILTDDDVCRLVGNTPARLDSITTGDGRFVYWWCPSWSTRPVNKTATALLLTTAAGLSARDVPLLRSDVVITSHCGGEIAGLTGEQFDLLCRVKLSRRDERILGRRCTRDRRIIDKTRKARATTLSRTYW